MLFSSLTFLFRFLPIVLLLYFLAPKRGKNFVLFLSSLVFYAWGEPVYVLLMLFSTIVDFSLGLAVHHFLQQEKKGLAKWMVFFSALINLSLLGFFKYSAFLTNVLNSMTGWSIPVHTLALPIGISFYTFQTMSYTIDIYRRRSLPQKNIISFGMYVALFPQLIAGPIVCYHDIEEDMNHRSISSEQISGGIIRFVIGLSKKLLLANAIGRLWESIGAQSMDTLPAGMAWLGVLAYGFQIYFDFSGYSDMAIGLGAILGFHFPENFNYPYISGSITEFWRRWHMTLGGWFRDYVYIPLGGNRKGIARQICNLLIVWALTGFWHGAAWNFLLWGIYFGVLIVLEKLFLLSFFKRMPSVLSRIYTILFLLIGWVIFAGDSLGEIGGWLSAMVAGTGAGLWNTTSSYLLSGNGILLLICAVGCTPLPKKLAVRVLGMISNEWLKTILVCAVLLILSMLCIANLNDASYNPFLYFRF